MNKVQPDGKLVSNFIKFNRVIENEKLNPLTSGNSSIRVNNNLIAIKPTGMRFSKIREKDISIIDMDGKLIKGKLSSSDSPLHLMLYKSISDINCVVHTHSHYASVFSILGKDISPLSTLHADFFGGKVPCLCFANHKTKEVINTIQNNIDKIKKANAFLIGNHGAFIIGKDTEKTFKMAIALEESARLNYHALLISRHIKKIPKTDIEIMHKYYLTRYGQQ
jgi:L-ribulose-5-phosphate 4-epimerase